MYNQIFGANLAMGSGSATLLVLLMVWSLFWKGLALWHSSRRGDYWWFVAVLVLNSIGILEIIYLFYFAKLKKEELFSMRETQGRHE